MEVKCHFEINYQGRSRVKKVLHISSKLVPQHNKTFLGKLVSGRFLHPPMSSIQRMKKRMLVGSLICFPRFSPPLILLFIWYSLFFPSFFSTSSSFQIRISLLVSSSYLSQEFLYYKRNRLITSPTLYIINDISVNFSCKMCVKTYNFYLASFFKDILTDSLKTLSMGGLMIPKEAI